MAELFERSSTMPRRSRCHDAEAGLDRIGGGHFEVSNCRASRFERSYQPFFTYRGVIGERGAQHAPGTLVGGVVEAARKGVVWCAARQIHGSRCVERCLMKDRR